MLKNSASSALHLSTGCPVPPQKLPANALTPRKVGVILWMAYSSFDTKSTSAYRFNDMAGWLRPDLWVFVSPLPESGSSGLKLLTPWKPAASSLSRGAGGSAQCDSLLPRPEAPAGLVGRRPWSGAVLLAGSSRSPPRQRRRQARRARQPAAATPAPSATRPQPGAATPAPKRDTPHSPPRQRPPQARHRWAIALPAVLR
jgi:hypothetical protein